MNAPFLWAGLPLLAGVAAAVWVRAERVQLLLGAGIAATLALGGWLIPVDEPFQLAGRTLLLDSTLTVLGRRLVLTDAMLPAVSAAYAAAFTWFVGSALLRPGRFFVSLSLAAIGLMTAAVIVQPLAFSGLFLLLAITLTVPVLAPPHGRFPRAVTRFLAFQAIGVPFLLMADSLLTGLESTPPGLALVARPSIFLGMGFVFLLGLFPFHAWIPRLFEDLHPYTAGFVLLLFPGFVSIIGLQLIDRTLWLRDSASVFNLIRLIGLITVLVGGSWTMFQRHLGRIMGYAAVMETGLILLAVGAGSKLAAGMFFPLLAARTLGFLPWSMGLTFIKQEQGSLLFDDLKGLARRSPLPALASLAGMLSSAGIPLLVGFAPRLRLTYGLAPQAPAAALGLWLGSAGVLIAALRTLAVFLQSSGSPSLRPEGEGDGSSLLIDFRGYGLLAAILLALAASLFPSWLTSMTEILPQVFTHLAP